jgi:hypothetical protein
MNERKNTKKKKRAFILFLENPNYLYFYLLITIDLKLIKKKNKLLIKSTTNRLSH